MPETPVATILVVEDEVSILDVITDALEDQGYRVHACTDAIHGLAILKDEPGIDLLFTDIRLPGGMNGWDLAEAARDIAPAIPLVYATGYTEGPHRILAGGQFFAKPYRIREVVETISDLLKTRNTTPHSQTETHQAKPQDSRCAPSASLSLSASA